MRLALGLAAALRSPLGDRGRGILRPGVAWVAGAELLAHLWVGVAPEACEVVGDLLRAAIRRQEVDDHWHAAGGQARRGGEAEELLDAGSEHRRAALFVTQVDAAAGGHGEALRGFAFEGGELRRRH